MEDAQDVIRDPNHNKLLAKRGEDAAAKYLKTLGYEILDRNWRCNAGEVDIVARDKDVIVFVEVKTRTNIDKGFPEESVTPQKRARYERIAAYYLCNYDQLNIGIRFDVVGLMICGPDRAMVRHHVNAFGAA